MEELHRQNETLQGNVHDLEQQQTQLIIKIRRIHKSLSFHINMGCPIPKQFQIVISGDVRWKKRSLRTHCCYQHSYGGNQCDKFIEKQAYGQDLKGGPLMIYDSPHILNIELSRSCQKNDSSLIGQHAPENLHHQLIQRTSSLLEKYLVMFNEETIKVVDLKKDIFVRAFQKRPQGHEFQRISYPLEECYIKG